MRRRSREINVFSLSAIDLFACAMGAFILLSLILFQYYLKSESSSPPPIDHTAKLEDQIQQYQQSLETAQKQIQQLQDAAALAQKALENQKAEAARNRQLAFLGIVTQAKSFVILLDMSGSMKKYEPLVEKTTDEILSQMDASYRIQIIGFQGHKDTSVPPSLSPCFPPETLVPMTPSNLSETKRFLKNAVENFNGGTPTYKALKTALRYDAEAIFLITDGEPTDIKNHEEIVASITKENAKKKKIYSIAVGKYREKHEFVDFLESLSLKNNGKFLGVSE